MNGGIYLSAVPYICFQILKMMKSNYAYKLFCVMFSMCLAVSPVFAQDATTTTKEASIDDLPIKPLRLPALQEVGGSPFFTLDYHMATVQMKNDIAVSNIPVKFNTYSNVMMVQKDGQEMKLESFETVSYDEADADGNIKHYIFGQGFPEVDKQTDHSIYQVVSTGPKVQLLKYYFQKVEDAATLGDYSRKEIVTKEQLYVYVPGGAIKAIKASKKDLAEALPALSDKIEEVVKANSLKMKSESDIALVIEALNKP
jgi:hypothetical protein